MSSLVHEWEASLTPPGGALTLSGALMLLNAELGTRYALTRLGQWRRGERPIPRPVVAHMQRVVILHTLREKGLLGAVLGPGAEELGKLIVEKLRLPTLKA
jgi:hypothetical protein